MKTTAITARLLIVLAALVLFSPDVSQAESPQQDAELHSLHDVSTHNEESHDELAEHDDHHLRRIEAILVKRDPSTRG